MADTFDGSPHIDRAMRIAQSVASGGKVDNITDIELTVIDGYTYDTNTGVQVPNITLSATIQGSLTNDFDRDRDIQNINKRYFRLHVSKERLTAAGVSIDMLTMKDVSTEGYCTISGIKYNINNISGHTGNLVITFYLEQH